MRMTKGANVGHRLGPFSKPKIIHLALETFVFVNTKIFGQELFTQRVNVVDFKGISIHGPSHYRLKRLGFFRHHAPEFDYKAWDRIGFFHHCWLGGKFCNDPCQYLCGGYMVIFGVADEAPYVPQRRADGWGVISGLACG